MSPGGVVHHSWWKRFLWVFALVCAGLLWFVSRWDFVAFMFVGYLLGYYIDPDLDQISITSSEGRMLRHFGCVGSVLVAYWMPYSHIMPHRSFLSHFPFVSTAIRLVYLLIVPFGVLWAIQAYYYPVLSEYGNWIIFYLIAIWLGLSVADGVHYILDEVN